jgi:hypothetical protein
MTARCELDGKYVVDSAESLHRLGDVKCRTGVLVLIDESESFLTQMVSRAGKVVCMDAFLSNKTVGFLKNLDVDTAFFKYTHRPVARTCERLEPFTNRLVDDVRPDKRVYFVCSARKKHRAVPPHLSKALS